MMLGLSVVMAAHSRSKDGRERPYVPAIPISKAPRPPKRGPRDKPGDDRCEMRLRMKP